MCSDPGAGFRNTFNGSFLRGLNLIVVSLELGRSLHHRET